MPVTDPNAYPDRFLANRYNAGSHGAKLSKRSGGVCECGGAGRLRCGSAHPGGRCPERFGLWSTTVGPNGKKYRIMKQKAHHDHNPENTSESNLSLVCRGCHNRHDRDHRNVNLRRTLAGNTGGVPEGEGGDDLMTTFLSQLAVQVEGEKPPDLDLWGKTFVPYPWAEPIMEALDAGKHIIVLKSRGVGFTLFMAYYATLRCLREPNYRVVFLSNSLHQSQILMEYVQELTKDVALPTASQVRTGFANGSWMRALPNSIKTTRGVHVDLVIWDEKGEFSNDRKMNAVIWPMINEEGGQMVSLSTPLGQRGLFWSEWQETEKHPEKSVYTPFTIRYTESPHITAEVIEEQKKALGPVMFRQEYLLEFLDEETTEFPISLLMRSQEGWEEPDADWALYRGVDFGKRLHPTAVVDVLQNPDTGHYYCRPSKLLRDMDYGGQLRWLKDHDHVTKARVDQTGPGERLVEELQRDHGNRYEGVMFTAPRKAEMVANAQRLFEDRKLHIHPDDSDLVRHLNSIRGDYTTTTPKYEGGGADHHADAAWALMLAVYKVNKGKIGIGALDMSKLRRR